MTTQKYILSLDQGTTSSRTLLVDSAGTICGMAQKEFKQIYPASGWVEHDPDEIWSTQWKTIRMVLEEAGIDFSQIAAIGITNQRETTIVWDKNSGKPVYNAIVWQDKRTAPLCETLKAKGLEDYIRENTGLVIDSYFSATKIRWILDEVEGARKKAQNGELLFGTVDSWLIWKLTGGKVHATDYTNASRTMLFNISSLEWDPYLLEQLDIPASMLPAAHASSALYGYYLDDNDRIPICGVAGDQQAALFGQACLEEGMAKNTYGTGCFMLMNTGENKVLSRNGLITTLACGTGESVQYALEGSVFVAGAALQWLRDGLKILKTAGESEKLAESIAGSDEVIMVPAFVGLGAPYWDMYARGAIFGLTRDVTGAHLAKAALESLAYQTRDVLEAMRQDSGIRVKTLKVDGGAVVNNYLMQFQADILNVPVERPEVVETTAMGAAYLAGIYLGWWDYRIIMSDRRVERIFQPVMSSEKRQNLYHKWQDAVERTRGWAK
ncbi:MAG: glycerol kinase [Bacteroidetes bacterium GWF2_49_14]|nr:MAG: glycerol kinase [Bacteroidetes bacterium GWF2_49_14]HBB92310.1 glycerol kinase [Bacteroidales bacterium]